MVLLPRRGNDDGATAGPSSVTYDRTAEMDVGKFFFVYENVTMRMKSEDEKAAEIICYLEGDAFDFYYETFAQNGLLAEDAKDFDKVKHALVERFAVTEEPEDNIRRAIAARLDYQDLIGSLREMDRWLEKAGFNSEARFGLLRNSVMQFSDLAQFAIYRGATTYESLRTTVKDFVAGRTVFFISKESTQPEQAV